MRINAHSISRTWWTHMSCSGLLSAGACTATLAFLSAGSGDAGAAGRLFFLFGDARRAPRDAEKKSLGSPVADMSLPSHAGWCVRSSPSSSCVGHCVRGLLCCLTRDHWQVNTSRG